MGRLSVTLLGLDCLWALRLWGGPPTALQVVIWANASEQDGAYWDFLDSQIHPALARICIIPGDSVSENWQIKWYIKVGEGEGNTRTL